MNLKSFLQPSNLLDLLLVLQKYYFCILLKVFRTLFPLSDFSSSRCVLFLISGTENNDTNHMNETTKKRSIIICSISAYMMNVSYKIFIPCLFREKGLKINSPVNAMFTNYLRSAYAPCLGGLFHYSKQSHLFCKGKSRKRSGIFVWDHWIKTQVL